MATAAIDFAVKGTVSHLTEKKKILTPALSVGHVQTLQIILIKIKSIIFWKIFYINKTLESSASQMYTAHTLDIHDNVPLKL